MALLDAQRDLGPPPLQPCALSVVVLLRNSPLNRMHRAESETGHEDECAEPASVGAVLPSGWIGRTVDRDRGACTIRSFREIRAEEHQRGGPGGPDTGPAFTSLPYLSDRTLSEQVRLNVRLCLL